MKSTPQKTKRNLRPRRPVTAWPVAISDLTSLDLVGLDGRQLRRLVTRRGIRHVDEGHRIIVRTEVLLDALELLEEAPKEASHESEAGDDDSADADTVLQLIGLRRTA